MQFHINLCFFFEKIKIHARRSTCGPLNKTFLKVFFGDGPINVAHCQKKFELWDEA
jgi:hypothetical protein